MARTVKDLRDPERRHTLIRTALRHLRAREHAELLFAPHYDREQITASIRVQSHLARSRQSLCRPTGRRA